MVAPLVVYGGVCLVEVGATVRSVVCLKTTLLSLTLLLGLLDASLTYSCFRRVLLLHLGLRSSPLCSTNCFCHPFCCPTLRRCDVPVVWVLGPAISLTKPSEGLVYCRIAGRRWSLVSDRCVGSEDLFDGFWFIEPTCVFLTFLQYMTDNCICDSLFVVLRLESGMRLPCGIQGVPLHCQGLQQYSLVV
jgi:hypothetical protein